MRMLAKKGMTMIIVTHEMNFAKEIGSRIMFLADKGIYEQGTPAQIFDNPQKEKTIAFIKKLKFISMHIDSRDFDLMELHGNIRTFGERYGLGTKAAYRLQLCAEELIYEMFKCADSEIDTDLSIEYSESEKCIRLNIDAKGKEYNPFTLSDDDEPMGVMIVKRTSQNYSHSYISGTNKISIEI
jgi:polar amino acid transport system ATP-binding protein